MKFRALRILCGSVFFCLATFMFVDFTGTVFGTLTARLQLFPALISLNLIVIMAWLLLSLLFGRVYCSFFCPLGVFLDIFGYASRKTNSRKRFRWQPARNIPRFLIPAAAVMAFLAGFPLWIALLEPYSSFGRIAVHLARPVYILGNNLLATIFTLFNSHIFYRVNLTSVHATALITAGFTFVVLAYLGWRHGRIYCNTLCPVGALLGVAGRFSLFKIGLDPENCNQCGLCERACKASCLNSNTGIVDSSRCVVCFDCISKCSRGAISFQRDKNPSPSDKMRRSKAENPSRRRFLASAVTGVFAASPALDPTGRTDLGVLASPSGVPLTPPGSTGIKNLLEHCTACHLCVGKCPSQILTPAFLEFGRRGILMPVMKFDNGFCNYDCTVCSNVCPTGAIQPLTRAQKHKTQVGRVVFTLEDCIVHTSGTSCGACAEHCPTQAVSMTRYRNGLTIPTIREALCIGCGGCEYICPALPRRAIRVEGLQIHSKARISKPEKQNNGMVDDFGF